MVEVQGTLILGITAIRAGTPKKLTYFHHLIVTYACSIAIMTCGTNIVLVSIELNTI